MAWAWDARLFVLLGMACPGSSFSEEGGASGGVCCAVLSLLAFAPSSASWGWEGRLVFLSGACPGKSKAKVEASFGTAAQLPTVDPRRISPSGDIAVGSFETKAVVVLLWEANVQSNLYYVMHGMWYWIQIV